MEDTSFCIRHDLGYPLHITAGKQTFPSQTKGTSKLERLILRMISIYQTQNAAVALFVHCLHSIVKASPYCGPTQTPTFSGLRDSNQVEFELLPTANPGSSSELLKRLSGDPAVCGWEDGDGSEFAGLEMLASIFQD